MGREPIFSDGQVIGYVSSANTGYSLSRHVAYAYLPPAFTRPGMQVTIEYFGEQVPATVATEPLFDPGGMRVKA